MARGQSVFSTDPLGELWRTGPGGFSQFRRGRQYKSPSLSEAVTAPTSCGETSFDHTIRPITITGNLGDDVAGLGRQRLECDGARMVLKRDTEPCRAVPSHFAI
jgi:hypothetical protein